MHTKRTLVLATLTLALSSQISAEDIFLSTDVPTPLGGTVYLTYQIAMNEDSTGAYTLHFDGLLFGMTSDVNIDAVAILRGSEFVFSTDAPFTDGVTVFQPSDIVKFSVTDNGFSLWRSGSSLGLGPSANIDALAFGRLGQLLASFDAPVQVGPDTFLPNDVVHLQASSLTLHLSGSSAGVPPGSNVVGYEESPGGNHLLVFDVPTKLASSTFLSGEIVELDGATFTTFFSDPAFPAQSTVSGFSLSPVIFSDGFESGDTSAW